MAWPSLRRLFDTGGWRASVVTQRPNGTAKPAPGRGFVNMPPDHPDHPDRPEHECERLAKQPDPWKALLDLQSRHRGQLFSGLADTEFEWGQHLKHLLVLGPPREYKTSGVIIPQVLQWAEGPVVSTSVREDVFLATAMARSR